MAITRDRKQAVYDKLVNDISSSESVVFVNFHGLGVSDTTELRRALRDKGLGYYVAKKTIIRRALDGANIEGNQPALDGEIAVAFGDDPVAPAKEVNEFVKKHKESLQMVGGVLEGRYLAAEETVSLANLPSQEELRGKLVNVMYAPVTGFVRTLNGTLSQFVQVLDQVAKTKEA